VTEVRGSHARSLRRVGTCGARPHHRETRTAKALSQVTGVCGGESACTPESPPRDDEEPEEQPKPLLTCGVVVRRLSSLVTVSRCPAAQLRPTLSRQERLMPSRWGHCRGAAPDLLYGAPAKARGFGV